MNWRRSAGRNGARILACERSALGLIPSSSRRALALAGLDVEAAAVQRTFDDIAVEKAVGQHGKSMRAGIVGRIELAIHVVDRDHVIADLDS